MQKAVTVLRGSLVENTHVAHIAVVDVQGKLLRWFNDPHRVTLVRSAAKPAQAAIAIETGAIAQFAFTSEEIALMCASHNSEDVQVEKVVAILAKLGATEADLTCGAHTPLSSAMAKQWLLSGKTPTPACNTCSGKHAGVLAAALALGAPIAGYQLPQHTVQVHTRHELARLLDLSEDQVSWAIDGCNLPTPAFALDRLARVYARVAAGTTPAYAQIGSAMTQHPYLVGGEGRFCTQLMQAFGGLVVGKMGADASYGLGISQSAAGPALGVSVKIEDGNVQIAYAVVCEILEQLNVGTPEQRAKLAGWHRPEIRNTAGLVVGKLQFDFTL